MATTAAVSVANLSTGFTASLCLKEKRAAHVDYSHLCTRNSFNMYVCVCVLVWGEGGTVRWRPSSDSLNILTKLGKYEQDGVSPELRSLKD